MKQLLQLFRLNGIFQLTCWSEPTLHPFSVLSFQLPFACSLLHLVEHRTVNTHSERSPWWTTVAIAKSIDVSG